MQSKISNLTVLDIVPYGRAEKENRFFAIRIERPDWKEWKPGQFLMLRPDSFGLEMPWGRPLCICHLTDRHLICFIQVVGRGTRKIAEMHPGDHVRIWGPLGNGFDIAQDVPTLLLAGGMGIAPFVGYVYRHPQPWNLGMVFGHAEPADCYPIDSINERIPVDTLRETRKGDLDNFIYTLHERIKDCAEQRGLVLACGPEAFLRTVQKFAFETGARAQLSLERRMACGVGACLGCVCKTTEKWPVRSRAGNLIQTCVNGPVFWADQVEL